MTEVYVDARRLAVLMGVSVRTVQRWTSEGMPSETWGMGHTRRYLLSLCVAWARERASISADQSSGRRTTAIPTTQRRRSFDG